MTVQEKTAEPNAAEVEAFGDRMIGILNDACTALMISIGHQTELFEALAGGVPATSEEIAGDAGLNARYVREWLDALTTARILVYDPDRRTYRLPAAHAAWLTSSAGPNDLGRTMLLVAMLAEVEQGIVGCFRSGGGLSYADYPRFHAAMAEDSNAVVDAALVNGVIPLVDGLVERLTSGIHAADIGCGSGHAVNVLARAFPRSHFTGFDFSEEAIGAARAEAADGGLTNARFEVLDAARLEVDSGFDLVTAFDAIHDQAEPAAVLRAVARSLRQDGTFLMVDINASSNVEDNLELPWAPFLYTTSTMHCMTVSLGLGGAGLGTMWGEQLATSMLDEAGFGSVDVRKVEEDPFNNYYVCRRQPND